MSDRTDIEPRPPEGDWLGTPYLRFERDGSIARLTVDRPDSRNAMTTAMYYGVRRAVDIVDRDHDLAGMIITGAGDVFIPGGELRGREPDAWSDLPDLMGNDLTPFESVRRSFKPIVAAVNGICQGGGLLIALFSDVAVCSDRATFRAPELLRGITDTFYAAALAPHIGVARARDMLFTGRRLTAEEAERWGLVARVVPHDDLPAAAEEAFAQIVRTAPEARFQLKRIINANYGNFDRMTFDHNVFSPEMVEGMTAFAEKREPNWVPDEFATDERL